MLAAIIIFLVIDLFENIRQCVIADLTQSLTCDYYLKSGQYQDDYIYYAKCHAYKKSFKYDNTMCSICYGNYADDEMDFSRKLLHCGHIYHKECLARNERYQWNHDEKPFNHPMSECSLCRMQYNASTQKFDYEQDYYQKLPKYMTGFDYFGKKTADELYWKPIRREFKRYRNIKDVSKRPDFMTRNIKGIIAIIQSIGFCGAKFVWKCMVFTWKLMK